MTTYKVKSIFRDSKGKELRRSTTFHDEAPDAREALRCAHITMTPMVESDPRIDSISSTVTGGGETISTTDYADEIGTGISSVGLMNEITPDMVDAYPEIAARALDAVLTDEQKQALIDAGKAKAVLVSGGGGVSVNVDDDADLFPAGTDGTPGLPAQARRQDPARSRPRSREEGGASVDADPFRSGRSSPGRKTNGPDAGTPQGSVGGTASAKPQGRFQEFFIMNETEGLTDAEWKRIRAVIHTGLHRDRLIMGKFPEDMEASK